MKILLLSVHPPEAGGSAYSSQELAVQMRGLGHEVIHLSPYKSTAQRPQYPGLVWFEADFPADLAVGPDVRSHIDYCVQETYLHYGPFDLVILGRESFLWQISAIRRVHHRKPVVAICRGAYINRLAGNEAIAPQLRQQLIEFYRDCDQIICIARHLVTALERVIGCHPTRFLPNPIALPPFTPGTRYHPTAQDPIRLLMAAQIKPRKRPLDALEIVRILVKKKLPVHLTICGSGIQMSQMLATIDRDRLHPYVAVKGRVDRAEVLDCLQKVETVLLCSDHEGLPRILQEAIAASKGIVAYNNPGSAEALTGGSDQWPLGRLVSVGDCHGASAAIVELARYFRSTATPVSLPPFPNTRAIVHEYEALFQGLISAQISSHSSLQAVR